MRVGQKSHVGGGAIKSLLGGLAVICALMLGCTPIRAQAPARPGRIVALDWTAASMLISLGVRPVGVADVDLYRLWVREPEIPAGVPDVGLRNAPNLEILAGLKPDLLLVSPLGAATRPILDKIAPTQEVSIYTMGTDPFTGAGEQLMALGTSLGRDQQALSVIATAELTLASLRRQLRAHPQSRFLIIQFLDGRFVRVYGQSSLFGSVLNRLGLANAWMARTNAWGFSLVGIERLAAFPDADILVIDPTPADVKLAPDPRSLWGNLPAVRAGRVHHLAAAWPFGELQAAERFARLLVENLAVQGSNAEHTHDGP
ncbi:ABC transporter substrate-binding protein [Labrys monachus]|uniref:Iron complex transport system substrate-binding protein n=1 Tax=Labrys monachus TaxID=217067 RepID=A0ABU0FHH7_9HYPH|nr:ABC transporter substrate-binding protein [Labrys monachus]MDQ0393584.1 iron complex transport system substrate-binding protein [Labrys monachus]